MTEIPVTIPDGATLLPNDGVTIDPDLDLSLSGVAPDDLVTPSVETPRTQVFGKSWQWDEDAGRFLRYGGAPAVTRGEDTAITWVKILLSIPRTSYPIFDDDIGLDDPWSLMVDVPLDAQTEQQWIDQITDALSIEPRFTEVDNFTFSSANDGVVYYNFDLAIDNSPDPTNVSGVITLG